MRTTKRRKRGPDHLRRAKRLLSLLSGWRMPDNNAYMADLFLVAAELSRAYIRGLDDERGRERAGEGGQ